MIKGLAHVAVTVGDLERSLRFYCDLLGFEVSRSRELPDGRKVVFLGTASGYALELFGLPDTRPFPQEAAAQEVVGVKHIALEVEDMDAAYQRLKGQGIAFQSEPRHMPESGVKIASFLDPDGLRIELVQFT